MVCYDGGMTIEARRTIVTVNAGSSSIKVAVFAKDPTSAKVSQTFAISLSSIGQSMATLQLFDFAEPPRAEENLHVADYAAATRIIIKKLAEFIPASKVSAVGHRVVHGGMKHVNPTSVREISEADWQFIAQLDPEHTAPARHLINEFVRYAPDALQVACFDTAFFRDLPDVAKILPLPKKYYALGVRRYGFHGLSYMSLLGTFRKKAGDVAANGRVILAHLGSGASLAAVRMGKPIDTTMSFTPTSGVIMSTRSGDLDPNIFSFLHREHAISTEEFNRMTSFESGLLGVSGVSSDMHQLLDIEQENENARMAIDKFVRDIKKSIAALSATIGGIDSLIFSGGIGEQSSVLRGRICQDFAYLGIEIDEDLNNRHEFLISSEKSRVGVHVIPTDEAQMIAMQTINFLNAPNEGNNGSN